MNAFANRFVLDSESGFIFDRDNNEFLTNSEEAYDAIFDFFERNNLSGMLASPMAIASPDGTITVVPKNVQVSVKMNDDVYSDISELDMKEAVNLLQECDAVE
jgi:hypothetical protein